MSQLGVLRRIMTERPPPRPSPGERCELCGLPVADEHGHVVNVETRSLLCVCRACVLLLAQEGAGGGHFRAVPERYLALPAFALSPAAWDELQIPVGMAFFFTNSMTSTTAAFYPSPAGATESLLPLDTWDRLVATNPVLDTLLPDTEALLVRVTGKEERTVEAYVVPIDVCYELVGHLRRLWRGFDGGSEARAKIDELFAVVRAKAAPR